MSGDLVGRVLLWSTLAVGAAAAACHLAVLFGMLFHIVTGRWP